MASQCCQGVDVFRQKSDDGDAEGVSGRVTCSMIFPENAQQVHVPHPENLAMCTCFECSYGCYTDDMQMTIALTRSLLQWGRCDPVKASQAYAQEFQPHRGYGGSAAKVRGLWLHAAVRS